MAVFYALGMFTSSFDIFGVINAGVNIRAAQLFLLVPMAVGLRLALLKNIRLPLGFRSLLIWTAFILVFVPHTTYAARSIGYGVWLVYSVLLIFATVQLFTNVEQVSWLVRWYLYSFLFVGTFGIAQFAMSVLGVGSPLVVQWWIPQVLPRVNGFSYEPSYFATYMLLGWVLSAALLEFRSTIVTRHLLRTVFAVCTLAMFLSSSRSGWIMMLIWCSRYPFQFVRRLLHGRVHRALFAYSLIVAGALGGAVAVVYVIGFDQVDFLLAGTGLEGAAAHSVVHRGNAVFDTIRIFLRSPVIGYSLGGVAPAIGELHGSVVASFQDAKPFEGNVVFMEVLAASGIVGFLVFVAYVAAILIRPFQLASAYTDENTRALLFAMVFSLAAEFLMLQFNQNILRPYLWIHIAILSAVYSVAQRDFLPRAQ